ncbi:MAG: YkgJ family cysteine cluster protein [Pyrinomonadaceae bacterium]
MLYQISPFSKAAETKTGLKKVEIVDGKINFVCLQQECPESCCGPFGGVQRGIESIEGRSFSEIILTAEDSGRLLAAGESYLIEMVEEGKYRMKLLEDGTCSALEDGKCSIHRLKPTVCRAFPFYVDMFVGVCAVTTCPGFGAGWTDIEDLTQEIEASGEMYQFWLDSIKRKNNSSE